jgi:hypothetical protein
MHEALGYCLYSKRQCDEQEGNGSTSKPSRLSLYRFDIFEVLKGYITHNPYHISYLKRRSGNLQNFDRSFLLHNVMCPDLLMFWSYGATISRKIHQ